jgi:hypothetical protein
LFDSLDAEFHFDRDVCARPENAKCPQFWTQEDDGLSMEWTGVLWMNPPYGRELRKWMAKAHEAARHGATVVCLIPARTDTKWFQGYCVAGEIRFIKGRLRFSNHEHSAPFPSAIVVFRPQFEGGPKVVFVKQDWGVRREPCTGASSAAKGAGSVASTQGKRGSAEAA